MGVNIEFYGIPRSRAGTADAMAEGTTLGEVLCNLARQFPDFAADCIVNDSLVDGYAANLNGQRFVRDPQTPIDDGDSLLILSSDAGG